MRRRHLLISSALVVASVTIATTVAAQSGDPVDVGETGEILDIGANTDNPSHPLGEEQAALKQIGVEQKLAGKTSGPVAEVAKGQFVELERQGEDSIFTVIGEFGPQAFVVHHRPVAQAMEEPALHLGGGGFGVGQAQHVLWRDAAQQQQRHPVGQNARLARTGIGRQPCRMRRIGGGDLVQGGFMLHHQPTHSGTGGLLSSHSP